MADLKITDLTLIAALELNDIIEVVDSPGGTPLSRSATFEQVRDVVLAPTPTNRGVPYYSTAAGDVEWSAAAPGDRLPLRTDEDGETLSYGADCAPLTQRAIDATNNGVTVCATIAHESSTAGAAGIGARCLFQARNSNGTLTLVDAAAVDGVLTTATSGAEVGALDVYARSGGSLTRCARFAAAEIELDTIVSFAKAVRSVAQVVSGTTHTLALTDAGNLRCTNTAARTITLPAAGVVTAAHAGLEWRIHDAARTADAANITITAPSGVTLNGVAASSVVLDTKGGAVIVRVVGLNEWETVGL